MGKTFLITSIASAISNGKGLPNMSDCSPDKVILYSGEDDIQDTIKPRLQKQQANDAMIYAYTNPITIDGAGLDIIKRHVIEHRPALIVFDPIVCFMGAKIDLNQANQVRSVLQKLKDLASDYNLSVIIVRHLSKTDRNNILHKGSGSIDYTAAARSVLYVAVNPDNKNERVILNIKNNVAPKGNSLGFKIVDGNFEWIGEVDIDEKDINTPTYPDNYPIDNAISFLLETLKSGPLSQKNILELAKGQNFSGHTLQRAKKLLKIRSYSVGEQGYTGVREWFWELPKEV